MVWKELPITEESLSPLALLSKGKLLLTATAGEKCNTMTIAWGALGTMWGVPLIFYAVRPCRYTYEFTEAGDTVTFSCLDAKYGAAVAYCGTHSGRAEDKLSAAGLAPVIMPCGAHAVAEAHLIIAAKKIYSHPISERELCDRALEAIWYEKDPYHTLYAAKIERIYVKS